MTGSVAIFVAHRHGRLDPAVPGLAALGRSLANQQGTELIAIVAGGALAPVITLVQEQPVDRVLVAEDDRLRDWDPDQAVRLLAGIITDLRPQLLLMSYSFQGIETGAALAARLGLPMFSNCTGLHLAEGGWCITRPLFRGSLQATLQVAPAAPLIVSLAMTPGTAGAPEMLATTPAPTGPAIVRWPVATSDSPSALRLRETLTPAGGNGELASARVIVAVGRGIGSPANLDLVRELAAALGATLACSRPLVDLGWLPAGCMVGISGSTVAPDVYVACGISGAAQHTAGMAGARRIIAINRDPEAPIFQVAHYGVVGDLFQVVPELIAQARRR